MVVAPVQQLGVTGHDTVVLRLHARTPTGRTRVRMIWEIKPLGTPFDMTDLGVGAWVDSTRTGVQLQEIVGGLSTDTPYHWRARLQYFPQMIFDRWVSNGTIGVETDFRTGVVGCVPIAADDTTCDNVDDDCADGVDEDYVVDVSCGEGVCQSGNTPSSCVAGVENPCTAGPKNEATDEICDGIDGDCDGQTDEDYVVDVSCGEGVCQSGNTPSTCVAGVENPCTAGPQNEATDETCDGIDGDCDGATDEDYVVVASCGMGVCQIDSIPSSCVAGVETLCTPSAQSESTDETCDGVDGDCDGAADEDYVVDNSCGVGACQSSNTPSACVDGVEVLCSPGAQIETSDETCDAIDGDCDGQTDEDYVAITSCGVGVCQTVNTPSSCANGVETGCIPGAQVEASDITCDGIDGDCDGAIDEDYVVDVSCGSGVCQSSNTPSSCVAGVEMPCEPGLALSDLDLSCDGVDDNCNGFVDEDVRSNIESACDPGGTCETVVCSPVSGQCESSWSTGCCEFSEDCQSPSTCVVGVCNHNLGICEYDYPADCCHSDNSCDDGNACTQDTCDQDYGRCRSESIQDCCLSNADCNDGDECTFDWCTTASRCLHGLVGCDSQSPCEADPSCVYSGLYLRAGEANPQFVRLNKNKTMAVLQLHLTNEALSAQLNELRLLVHGFTTELVLPGNRYALVAELHQDLDGDGVLDNNSSPLGPAVVVDTQNGQVVLRDLTFRLLPAWSGHLLVTLRLEPRLRMSISMGMLDLGSFPLGASGFLLIVLLILYLTACLLRRRRLYSYAVIVVMLVCLNVIPISCSRAGFETITRGNLVLQNNEDIVMTIDPLDELDIENVKLQVVGAPVEGAIVKLVI